jgi:hypothetical protein
MWMTQETTTRDRTQEVMFDKQLNQSRGRQRHTPKGARRRRASEGMSLSHPQPRPS